MKIGKIGGSKVLQISRHSKLDLILTCDPSVGEAWLRDEDATKADKGLLPIIYCV